MNETEIIKLVQDQAAASQQQGGISVGAVLVKADEIVVSAHDCTLQNNNPIALAEMECMRRAGRRSDHAELCLYTGRMPDMLCAGTLVQFGVGKLVITVAEQDSGVVDFLRQHGVDVDFAGASS
jgi:cytosine/creatinine deaminase